MIETIVEMDKKARAREQEAETYKKAQIKSLDDKIRGVEQAYREKADAEIARLTEEDANSTQRRLAQIRQANQALVRDLEQAYAHGREAWAAEIVTRALAGD